MFSIRKGKSDVNEKGNNALLTIGGRLINPTRQKGEEGRKPLSQLDGHLLRVYVSRKAEEYVFFYVGSRQQWGGKT